MATLKEHQAAMVDLLANGSGIPASASRLAHAMHDVLEAMTNQVHEESMQQSKDFIRKYLNDRADATTPGLNDKALSKREKALKTDSHAKWPTPAEQRVKELENTIRQLKANNAKLKQERDANDSVLRQTLDKLTLKQGSPQINDACWVLHDELTVHGPLTGHQFNNLKSCFYKAFQVAINGKSEPEQAGCRKSDTQLPQECLHLCTATYDAETLRCNNCGAEIPE